MIYCDRIDASKGTAWCLSLLCDSCHYWCFSDKGFKFQPDACNGCHGVLMMSVNFNDIAVLNIEGIASHYIINGISKSEAIILLKDTNLTKKVGHYKI